MREPIRTRLVWTAALVLPLVACTVLALLRDSVPNAQAALVLVLVVVGVAAAGSRGAGIAAALSSAVWFDVFLTEPYGRLTIDDRDDVETAVLLTLVGLAVSELALWGRRQQARFSRSEGYLDGVVAAAGMAARGEADASSVVAFVSQQILEVLGVSDCVFVAGPPGAHPRLTGDGSVTVGGRPVDVDRTGLPVQDVIELPVENRGTTFGRFVLTASSEVVRPSPEQRRVAVALAEQAGAAMAASDRPTS